MLNGLAVVLDFLDVVDAIWRVVAAGAGFVFQNFDEGCLGAFDSAGKHGFLGGERGEQDVCVGHCGEEAIEVAERSAGGADERH